MGYVQGPHAGKAMINVSSQPWQAVRNDYSSNFSSSWLRRWSADRQFRTMVLIGASAAALLIAMLIWIFAGGPGKPGAKNRLTPAAFDPKSMEEIDARKLPDDKKWPKSDVIFRRRPWTADDDNGVLEVENLKIHHSTNQKAIDIGLVSPDRVPGKTICYAKVIVRNCDIYEIRRDDKGQQLGLHTDFLRICGGGNDQPIETEILIENVRIHDGSSLPLLVQDGKYKSITLRRVSIENTTNGGGQISAINTGHVKDIIVEDCPGLGLAIMGRPGSIERCVVRNSPGSRIADVRNVGGQLSGVQITIDNKSKTDTVGAVGQPHTARLDPSDTNIREPATAPATAVVPVPAPAPAGPVKLQVSGDVTGGHLRCLMTGGLPEDLAFIVFEAFDKDDYRMGQAQIITQAPWEATFDIKKAGTYRIEAQVRHLGGDPDPMIKQVVDVTSPK